MRALEPDGLDPRRRELVAGALREDPALAEELELISGLLGEGARATFWRALADGCAGGGRPAAAVLGALERAAEGD